MKTYPSGTRIGQYEVAGRPLMGGMGIVYICFDHGENRPVALKTFRPEFLPDRAARDRFLREGTAWVDLGAHPHVVHCYRVFILDVRDEVYLVLELVAKEQGRDDASLRAWLMPGHPLPIKQALLFALQIARGMKHATDVIPGFVHRDLKPENVLVGADRLSGAAVNRLRVTDFGLAAVLESASERVSESAMRDTEHAIRNTQLTHGAVGTPLYMAPEQWQGQPVTAATDVYALGCTLYEMLAGQRAVSGHSLADVRRAHCAGDLRPLPPALNPAVEDVIARCLALSPRERYASWQETGQALARAYQQVTGRAVPQEEPVALLSRGERIAAGWSYGAMGASYSDIGKAEVAAGYFERSREVGSTEGERPLEGAALGGLGVTYANLGDAQRATRYLEQCLAIHREIGDRRGEGDALGSLGIVYHQLGNARRAIGYYEQALAIAREIGDRRGECAGLDNLGIAYADLGNARRAIGYHEQALVIAREIGDRRGEGTALGNLGLACAYLGDARRAIRYYEQALEIACDISDRRGEGNALGNLGIAYKNLGDARRAIGYYEQQLVITHEIGDRRGEGNALMSLGNAYADLGDARRAIQFYEQCLTIHREIGNRRGEGNALMGLGNAYANLSDARRAIGYWEHALAINREIGNVDGVAMLSFNMALLHSQQGAPDRALLLAQQAADIWEQIGSPSAQHAQQLVAQLQAGGGTTKRRRWWRRR